MMKKAIDRAFEWWGRYVFRHPWLAILLMLLFTVVPGAQLVNIRIDNSIQAFLHPDDPTLLVYNDFRDKFGHDDLVIIGIAPPDVFDLEFLAKLRRLHNDLEARVPHVDEITSLINARWTRTKGDELIVEELLTATPQSEEDLAKLRERVLGNPLYVNTLISEDGRLTTVAIKPVAYSPGRGERDEAGVFEQSNDESSAGTKKRTYLTDVETSEILTEVRSVLSEYESPDFPVHVTGSSVLVERLDFAMMRDVKRLIGLSMLSNAVVLFALFGNVAGVLLPLAVAILSVVCTLGLMVLLGIPLSMTTEIIPTFLLIVGVCDSMHLLVIFQQQLRKGDGREDAIAHALRHSGLAIFLTSLTTAGGLLSFVTAELALVSYFGIVAPLGVMLALVFTLVLLPALLAVVPFHARLQKAKPSGSGILDRLLIASGELGTRRPLWVVSGTATVLLIAILGMFRLHFGQNELAWFPKDEPLREATALLDRKLRGVMTVEVLIETGEEEAFQDPVRLNQLEAIARHNESLVHEELFIGKTLSISDVVKEVHKALNDDRPEYYAIPGSRDLVAQELLLFESLAPDDLMDVTDNLFSSGRLTLKVPKVDARLYPEFLEKLRRSIREVIGNEVDLYITGLSALLGRVMAAVIVSMATSYAIAFAVITPLMIFVVGSIKRGLISMIPNLTPVVITLGIMGWAGIPLDAFSLLVGCIIIGLAVDDTIHFMHNFGRYYAETGDVDIAVRNTLMTTGSALLFTSLVLVAGCVSFTFAYMTNIATFGVLIGIALVTAFLADVLLGPALMTLVTSTHPTKKRAIPGSGD